MDLDPNVTQNLCVVLGFSINLNKIDLVLDPNPKLDVE